MKNFTVKSFLLLIIINSISTINLLNNCYANHIAKKEVRCVIHIHSKNYHSPLDSSSLNKPLSLEEILTKARSEKIDALIITDTLSGRINLTPFPLAPIISIKKNFPSILSRFPEKYLLEIARLNKKYQDIILIPGAEISSDHWWRIPTIHSLLRDTKTIYLMGWHRHLIAAGLEEPSDYYNMAVSGGGSSDKKIEPLMLWPILILIFAIGRIKKRPIKGFFIFLIGIIILAGNYPFVKSTAGRISIGEGDYTNDSLKGTENFQNVINHTIGRGGLIFWAHPEAKNNTTYRFKSFEILTHTEPYPELLARTNNYTGFAIFAEGYRNCGNPGGVWDKLLVEYCRGTKTNPVWAISEADFAGDNEEGSLRLGSLQNILWFEQNEKITKKSILEKLKNGNSYALWQGKKTGIYIKNFYIAPDHQTFNPKPAIFGETIEVNSDAMKMYLELKSSDNTKTFPAKILLVSNGKTRLQFETTIPCKITHTLKLTDLEDANNPPSKKEDSITPNKQRKGYIRFFIDAGYPNYIATNPVFYVTKGF